ncbi:hypothetical protein BKA93DRAFT_821675 [Sparassis latifolia]|uniref:Outer spore wall protein n=1 Tax=Sparassis crispa TaxID=139825 RepID=A0A401GY54_9APHY|nr:hypothetical protein SCP_0906140 [Sparassis crispa]GBE86734.1 hypothetical protein SCP_0906140 [Sparassis crispa]
MSSKSKEYLQLLLKNVTTEVQEISILCAQGLASFTWLWPLRGIYFAVNYPSILLSVRGALAKSLVSSAIIFGILALLTYSPQVALLALFTGPLAPILALLLVSVESLVLLCALTRPLFLDPALVHLFDATLLARGQAQLVREGKTRAGAPSQVSSTLVRPLKALSSDGVVRYVLSLPLNLVPVLGTAAFLLYNGDRSGAGWHARYFQLKGLSKSQRRQFVKSRRAQYAAFGTATLLFNFIPFVGLVFSFTNTIGAAMWAAQIEAQANPIGAEEKVADTLKTQ